MKNKVVSMTGEGIMEQVTLTVTLSPVFSLRLWIAAAIMRIACWVAGCKYSEQDTGPL